MALLSDEFQPQALYQGEQVAAGALDAKGILSLLVWVPHPISDQTQTQMRAKADRCYGDVVKGLTQGLDASSLAAKLSNALSNPAIDTKECKT